MLEATVQQYQEWARSALHRGPLAHLARDAANRQIVQRLQRGEDLHEQGGVSRYY